MRTIDNADKYVDKFQEFTERHDKIMQAYARGLIISPKKEWSFIKYHHLCPYDNTILATEPTPPPFETLYIQYCPNCDYEYAGHRQ
jgi:hypothetical protein